MDVATSYDNSVASTLAKHIKPFKAKLNIVENPSVGTLAVPVEVSKLIGITLKAMLKVSQNRGGTRVRVICTVDHLRHLWLEVHDDAPWYDAPAQAQLSICSEHARLFGGTVSISKKTGGEATARLVVPLPTDETPATLAG